MNVIQAKLPSCFKNIEIIPIGDIHYGSKECDIDLLKKTIEYIRNTKNCYCILNGDLLDNAIIDSKGNSYDSTHSIDDCIDFLVTTFKPIKHKILGITNGNHEERTRKKVDIDITRRFASEIGLKDYYSQEGYVLCIAYKKKLFTMYNIHGNGGGKTIGSKANGLEKKKDTVCNMDMYITGHTHQGIIFPKSSYVFDEVSLELKYKESLFINHSAFMNFGGYGHILGYTPCSKSNPNIILSVLDNRKYIKSSIEISNE